MVRWLLTSCRAGDVFSTCPEQSLPVSAKTHRVLPWGQTQPWLLACRVECADGRVPEISWFLGLPTTGTAGEAAGALL